MLRKPFSKEKFIVNAREKHGSKYGYGKWNSQYNIQGMMGMCKRQ